MKRFITVVPCGVLYAGMKEYWLVKPEPIVRDSWQHDFQQRWLVIPKGADCDERQYDSEQDITYYPHKCHLICTDAIIEYGVYNYILCEDNNSFEGDRK
jgi:hypothetical protein